ncbi:MAG: hypothetical protein U5K54_14365 [Cytophagales bacterium]|nr:hypothetical protein [Cytophagales bacterium]
MRSLLFCAMLLAQFTMAQPKQTKVTVYTGDFTGMKEELAVGRYNNLYLAQSGISFVGSVRVPAGMKVTLYTEDNHTGSALTIMEDATTRYLKAKGFAEIGLQLSVIVEFLAAGELPVTPPYITLYQNNFAGASKNLSEGRYESHDFGFIENDQVSSVKSS